VQITPELHTSDLQPEIAPDRHAVHLIDPTAKFSELLRRVFPDGLQGRSVLDCACNCGAYLFLCKDHGAGECLGFDVREQWIRQARWLLEHRDGDPTGVRFEVHDLLDLPELDIAPFDVVLFRGIFYHLADPIEGLRIAAGMTREVLLMHTATISGWRDGAMVARQERDEHPLSGVHGFQWFPTGPRVLMQMAAHAGLPESRCHRWWGPSRRKNLDRVDLVAARNAAVLRAYDAGRPTDLRGRMDGLANVSVPPHSTVAVLAEVVPELPYRETLRFEPGEDFRAALAACGADYVLTAGQGLHRANETGLMDYLNETFMTAGQDPPHAVIHDLRTPRASAS
jgi:hypothetical protein